MGEVNFTKEHTQIAKGMAIILMLIHHLFAFPNRILTKQSYKSLLLINGLQIEYYIGVFGKICVAMFLFLSGYGLYIITSKNNKFSIKDAIIRISRLYINYWTVFLIFIPIGFIFFGRTLNIKEFILNFLGLSSSYNGEWWFFRLYVELILITPILKIIVRDKLYLSFINIIMLVLLSKVINKIFFYLYPIKYITDTIIYNDLISLLNWQSCFFMGYICAKFKLFTKIKEYMKIYNIDNKFIYLLMMLLVFFIRYKRSSIFIDSILSGIFIFAIVNILYDSKLHKLFVVLGENSMNMWLTHSFFCYYYIQSIVYKPRISVFILIWLIVLSLLTSLIIKRFSKYLNKIAITIFNYFKFTKSTRNIVDP